VLLQHPVVGRGKASFGSPLIAIALVIVSLNMLLLFANYFSGAAPFCAAD
jgi:hypothetical protein